MLRGEIVSFFIRMGKHICCVVSILAVLYLISITSPATADNWQNVSGGLHGAVGSTDLRYAPREVPQEIGSSTWRSTAWRGERVNGQFVLWSKDEVEQVRLSVTPLTGPSGNAIPASHINAAFIHFVLADPSHQSCGRRPPTETPVLTGDVIDTVERVDMGVRTTRPVWLSVDVPGDTPPGVYSGALTVTGKGGVSLTFALNIDVLPLTLPPPDEWSFHLDLWQNPWAIARYHHVKPWSEEHWLLLGQLLRTLAHAGQKCLTTTIVERPWNGQTYDAYGSLVTWTKNEDGTFSYDYSLFDRYVEFGLGCGINKAINCYSMIPWGYNFHYYEAETGDLISIHATAGTPEYDELWTPFLKDFTGHLRERGWFDKTVIAMDERPVEDMLKVISLVRRIEPDLKLALAGNNHPELYDEIHDYCFIIKQEPEQQIIRKRLEHGQPTTFYVCCTPHRPNNFTFSPPVENTWMGWFAFARGYNGFLRWAANSWVEDPLHDTSFTSWQSGDTFLLYPGPRSSIRFERLREGIQDYEKLCIVRRKLEAEGTRMKPELHRLNEVLACFHYPDIGSDEVLRKNVNDAKQCLEQLSRKIAGQ